MKIQFNSPVTLNAEDGSKLTLGKGLHDVDAKFANDWYLQAMVKDGSAVVMREEKEVEGEVIDSTTGPKELAEKSVKEIEAILPELVGGQLQELLEAEKNGKNRKSLIEQIEKAIEVRGVAE